MTEKKRDRKTADGGFKLRMRTPEERAAIEKRAADLGYSSVTSFLRAASLRFKGKAKDGE